MSIFLLTLFSSTCFAHSSSRDHDTEHFTPEALKQLRDDVRDLISANMEGLTLNSEFSTIYDFGVAYIDPADKNEWVLLPTIIRLPFHDCAGTSPGLCDGCIDLDDPHNAGLFEGAVDPLSDICDYNNDLYGLSYADCWALSATFAIELSSENNDEIWNDPNCLCSVAENKPTQLFFPGDIPYYIGRQDCATTPDVEVGTQDNLPENEWAWELSSQFMREVFDMTNREIVGVISGGHSIGRGHLKLSGYSGIWDLSPGVIDNDYHWQLIPDFDRIGTPLNWQQDVIFNASVDAELAPLLKPHFHLFFPPDAPLVHRRFGLMLNVDISLYYNLSYYMSRGLENDIDCYPQATSLCAIFHPTTVVGGPGETQADYPNDVLCPLLQCPINCEGGQAQLDAYIANDFVDIDENVNCPAAFLYKGFADEHEFADAFLSGFVKMITAGYEIDEDEHDDDHNDVPRLRVIEYPEDEHDEDEHDEHDDDEHDEDEDEESNEEGEEERGRRKGRHDH